MRWLAWRDRTTTSVTDTSEIFHQDTNRFSLCLASRGARVEDTVRRQKAVTVLVERLSPPQSQTFAYA
ncbi:hypothetical protein E2C01_068958 [Portunus trituberculatus]|uniref:Uncharacterized protein n=1 Tax=Portunus trituberculatus TaxID=210409 RepID=A0A5B7HTD6_PORTR|nr:hypothetical protein [Portunus trituberculatus]